jgi:hypothetical protein
MCRAVGLATCAVSECQVSSAEGQGHARCQVTCARVASAGCQVSNAGCQVPSVMMPGAGCQVPGAKCQVPGCHVPGAKCQVPCLPY